MTIIMVKILVEIWVLTLLPIDFMHVHFEFHVTKIRKEERRCNNQPTNNTTSLIQKRASRWKYIRLQMLGKTDIFFSVRIIQLNIDTIWPERACSEAHLACGHVNIPPYLITMTAMFFQDSLRRHFWSGYQQSHSQVSRTDDSFHNVTMATKIRSGSLWLSYPANTLLMVPVDIRLSERVIDNNQWKILKNTELFFSYTPFHQSLNKRKSIES